MKNNRTIIILSILIATIPLIYLIFFVAEFMITTPFWDQWNFVPDLEKYFSGNLSLKDIWAQHNEHRLLFPKAIMLLLADLTSWNVVYEKALNFVIAIGIFSIFYYLIYKDRKRISNSFVFIFLTVIVSVVIFSLSQWENWIWGWQIQIFLNVFMAILCLTLLSNTNMRVFGFIVAVLSAIVASYSFGNGLALWFVGFLGIFLNEYKNLNRKMIMIIWSITGILTIFSYAYKYSSPKGHPTIFTFIENPHKFIGFILVALGTPVLHFSSKYAALIAGIIIFTAFLILIAIIIKSKIYQEYKLYLPYILFISYSLLSITVLAVGRSGFGYIYGSTSRYVTISNIFIISFLILSAQILFHKSVQTYKIFKRVNINILINFLFSLLLVVLIYNFYRGKGSYINRYKLILPVKKELIKGDEGKDEILKHTYIDTKLVKDRLKILKKHNLSIFNENKEDKRN